MILAAVSLALILQDDRGLSSTQATEVLAWIDGLGYSHVLNSPFVDVSSLGSAGQSYTTAYGFLVDDKPDQFEIVTPGLTEAWFSKSAKDGGGYRYHPADLKTITAKIIQVSKEKYPGMDDPFATGIGPAGSTIFQLTAAWICEKKGWTDQATTLTRGAKFWANPQVPKFDPVQLFKEGYAGQNFAALVEQLEQPFRSRQEMLPCFEQFLNRYGGMNEPADAKDVVAKLRQMVGEDKEHKSTASLTKPTQEQQIAEDIWQLRNEHNMFDDSGKAHQDLVTVGIPAVPRLIAALHDDRFTRQFFYQDSGPRAAPDGPRVMRVSDIAQQALESISHSSFRPSNWNDKAAIEKEAKAWFASYKGKGKERSLIEGTLRADSSSPEQAAELARSYPKDAIQPISQAYAKMSDKSLRSNLIGSVESLPSTVSRPFLLRVIHSDKFQQARVEAIEQLARFEPETAVRNMVFEWTRIDGSEEFPLTSNSISGFLLESGRKQGIQAIQDGFRKRNPQIRQEVISFFAEGFRSNWGINFPNVPTAKASPGQRAEFTRCAEDLLGYELNDHERWGGSYSSADVTFSAPELSEMSCYALSNFLPTIYKFKKTSSFEEQEQQRVAFLNIYRRRRGLSTIVSDTKLKENVLSATEMKPLIERLGAGNDRTAPQSVLAKGLPALHALLLSIKNEKNETTKSRLLAVARPLSCTLSSVQLFPGASPSENNLANRLRKSVGTIFNTEGLLEFIETIAKEVVSKSTRPVSVVVQRDASGSGFVVSLMYHSMKLQGSAGVMLNGETIRGLGGGDASSFIGAQDDYIPSGIKRCIESAPDTNVTIQYEMAIPWHQDTSSRGTRSKHS